MGGGRSPKCEFSTEKHGFVPCMYENSENYQWFWTTKRPFFFVSFFLRPYGGVGRGVETRRYEAQNKTAKHKLDSKQFEGGDGRDNFCLVFRRFAFDELVSEIVHSRQFPSIPVHSRPILSRPVSSSLVPSSPGQSQPVAELLMRCTGE